MAIQVKKRQTKVDESYLQLMQLSNRLGAGARLPSVAQLKSELGVSLTTLDSALVRLEEEKVIRRVQGSGIFVALSIQPLVSLICDPMVFRWSEESPFWNTLIDNARSRAELCDEQFEMHFAHPSGAVGQPFQRGIVRDFDEKRISGVIGLALTPEAADWIESQNVPFVNLFGAGQHNVLLDMADAMRLGVRELSQAGCRRLGLWQPTSRVRASADAASELKTMHRMKFEPFRVALAKFGLSLDESALRECELQAGGPLSYVEQGKALVNAVFGAPRAEWPDGLVIGNDILARAALLEMERLGVVAGRDVQIVAQANAGSPTLAGFEHKVTTVEFSPRALVDATFGALEKLMGGQEAPSQIWVKAHRVCPRNAAMDAVSPHFAGALPPQSTELLHFSVAA